MPRKPKISREAMVRGAFRLIREQGHEALTARSLAASLGCSTQPVMYQFPSLESLWDQAYQEADAVHTAYILEGEDLLEMGLRYIRFAGEEPRLFRFLFQSGRFSDMIPEDLIRAPESGEVLASVIRETGLSPEEAAAWFEPLFALVHGYASLAANNAVIYDPDRIRKALIRAAQSLEGGIHDNTL